MGAFRGPVAGVDCLLALIFVTLAGAGLALHLRWVFAAVFFPVWVAGYAFGRGHRRSGGRSRR
jgi:hypothetical protein